MSLNVFSQLKSCKFVMKVLNIKGFFIYSRSWFQFFNEDLKLVI